MYVVVYRYIHIFVSNKIVGVREYIDAVVRCWRAWRVRGSTGIRDVPVLHCRSLLYLLAN